MLSFDANYSIFSGFFFTEMYLFPERVLVLSFDANYSIFCVFLMEMYLFPERVLVLSFDANYSIFSGFFNGNVPLP